MLRSRNNITASASTNNLMTVPSPDKKDTATSTLAATAKILNDINNVNTADTCSSKPNPCTTTTIISASSLIPSTIPKHSNNTNTQLSCFVIQAIILSSLGGVLFGYDLGVISNALPQITQTFDDIVSTSQKESIVSFLYIGGGFGAALGGILCDKVGRKKCILFTDVIFLIGGITICFSSSYRDILIGRFILGFGVSTSGIADVAYLHEISPTSKLRGALVSCNEACISLGFLISYIVGYGINVYDPHEGWRLMFGISCFIAISQFIGMLFMPESPKWLLNRGRVEEARDVMLLIGGGSLVEEEDEIDDVHIGGGGDNDQTFPLGSGSSTYMTITSYDTMDTAPPTPSSIPTTTYHNITYYVHCLCTPLYKIIQMMNNFYMEFENHLPQSCIALFLSMSQQFSGHHNVLNFAPDIFTTSTTNVTNEASMITLVLGVIKFVITIFVIIKIERVGRRRLLLGGIFCMSLSHLMLGIALSSRYKTMHENSELMAIFGAIGVITGYASSYGPLTWLLTSEMFPTSIRGRALGISTVLNYITASFLSYTFLSVQEVWGISIPFYIYSFLCFLSFGFCYMAIPDTGNKSCDRIDLEIRNMKFWRFISFCFTFVLGYGCSTSNDGARGGRKDCQPLEGF